MCYRPSTDQFTRKYEKFSISRLDISANTIGCTLADDETVHNKLNILKETSYQACKHVSYLEYLKTFYEKTNNLYSEQEAEEVYGTNIFTDIVTPQEISNDINTRKNAVAREISQTYKVFPIANSPTLTQDYQRNELLNKKIPLWTNSMKYNRLKDINVLHLLIIDNLDIEG